MERGEDGGHDGTFDGGGERQTMTDDEGRRRRVFGSSTAMTIRQSSRPTEAWPRTGGLQRSRWWWWLGRRGLATAVGGRRSRSRTEGPNDGGGALFRSSTATVVWAERGEAEGINRVTGDGQMEGNRRCLLCSYLPSSPINVDSLYVAFDNKAVDPTDSQLALASEVVTVGVTTQADTLDIAATGPNVSAITNIIVTLVAITVGVAPASADAIKVNMPTGTTIGFEESAAIIDVSRQA
ncbi:hypothetical protein GUJ93_ZPchr0010g10590 [Zizania palustris]|uniref:Uncharacterized protein n=1 Tax=Zizania palustris TaxID=103762 RepID=A0A8J5T9F0_ZIZPA|nr:hypothetical protein GUJ93_ZPchr0010g10590 [Zizania palustris]